MNFGEIRFWLLLLAGMGGIASLRWLLGHTRSGLPPSFDRLALCALGLFLLCCVSWLTFAIFMVVGLCSYYGMKWILATHTKGHSYYLFILIPLLLLPLFYYKYSNFMVNGVLGLRVDYFRDLALPGGISFYTFQKISGFAITSISLSGAGAPGAERSTSWWCLCSRASGMAPAGTLPSGGRCTGPA
jgi:D-alanyl-lipoteichoic acid acyltransferase DltB (MBOAT superfamily)